MFEYNVGGVVKRRKKWLCSKIVIEEHRKKKLVFPYVNRDGFDVGKSSLSCV